MRKPIVNEVCDGTTKSTGRRILGPLLGRPRLQPFFRSLHAVALAGMGYGEGGNPATSGEEGVLGYIQSALGADRRVTVVDVGANVGEYADQVLARWGERVDLRCFEPSTPTFSILSGRLAGRPNVTLENLGLSDRDGSAILYTRGAGSKVASVHAGQTSDEDGELCQHEEIRVRTLDAYCASHNIAALDYLKVDVEGHELNVLQGARTMLRSGAIHFIQFEMSASCINARVFFRDFWEILDGQYDLFRVLAHGLLPIASYDETLEVFKRATNYLAERRSPG
jgi:FkbM family methyltransferase